MFLHREYIVGIVQSDIFFFCHNLCTLTFNITHTHHAICMDYHYIYMYMITISSIHSHIDANTLHIKHMCTPAITNAHIHTAQYLHVLFITFTCIWYDYIKHPLMSFTVTHLHSISYFKFFQTAHQLTYAGTKSSNNLNINLLEHTYSQHTQRIVKFQGSSQITLTRVLDLTIDVHFEP